jgi:hypothetical protein
MPKKLTITVPDDAYSSLQSAAGAVHITPEELASQVVLERVSELAPRSGNQVPGNATREAILAMMRARHHLVEHPPKKTNVSALPPLGSPERVRLDVEIAAELGDALIQSGLSVLDLIERR